MSSPESASIRCGRRAASSTCRGTRPWKRSSTGAARATSGGWIAKSEKTGCNEPPAQNTFVSRAYNGILRVALRARFSDAQCGFKALRSEVAHELLPHVADDGWFFDTELLVLAERAGLRIHEVPVDWVDDPDSRVNIVATAAADLCGVWRLLTHRPERTVRDLHAP